MINNKLLKIENLTVRFTVDEGNFKAVEDVSFFLNKGEIVGLVGESGCGKSVTALSITRLIPSPPGKIENGKILFKGNDILDMDIKTLRKIRGGKISMIFQEPAAALSPLHRVGKQLTETLLIHRNITEKSARKMAQNWLEKVGISDSKERMFAYPFQLSGGMQQRVVIAMALMLEPDIVIADEPTTALDVTIQAQVFELINKMRDKNTTILLITHDMGVVWEMCDRVIVMYASRVVEEGCVNDIFNHPAHPYTRGLLQSVPGLFQKEKRLKAISGQVPSPLNYPTGCYFRNRCPHAFDRCKKEQPELTDMGGGQKAACFWVE